MSDLFRQRQRRTSFKVDRAYFREQAREATRTFFGPLAGLYAAFKEPISPRRD